MTDLDIENLLLDLIHLWHLGDGCTDRTGKIGRLSLPEYLDVTDEDYAAWVEQRLTDEELWERRGTRARG